jgi:hypothetical protein
LSAAAVLLPLFVQVGLTFVLLIRLGLVRYRAVSDRMVKVADIALGQKVWPDKIVQLGNCFDNQFQIPALYYLLTVLVLELRLAGLLFLVLAWIFVLSRIVHAAIHTGSNVVLRRFQAYVVGVVVLTLMWASFAFQVIAGL